MGGGYFLINLICVTNVDVVLLDSGKREGWKGGGTRGKKGRCRTVRLCMFGWSRVYPCLKKIIGLRCVGRKGVRVGELGGPIPLWKRNTQNNTGGKSFTTGLSSVNQRELSGRVVSRPLQESRGSLVVQVKRKKRGDPFHDIIRPRVEQTRRSLKEEREYESVYVSLILSDWTGLHSWNKRISSTV